jgi:hypothetical protein
MLNEFNTIKTIMTSDLLSAIYIAIPIIIILVNIIFYFLALRTRNENKKSIDQSGQDTENKKSAKDHENTVFTLKKIIISIMVTVSILCWSLFVVFNSQLRTYTPTVVKLSSEPKTPDPTIVAGSLQSEASLISTIIQFLSILGTVATVYFTIQHFLLEKRNQDEDLARTTKESQEKFQEERYQVEKLHQENYNKDILRDFNMCPHVRNGKIILESIADGSNYLPHIHLELFEKPGAVDLQTGQVDPLCCNYASYSHDDPTLILSNPKKFEIIPSLQTLANAFMVDEHKVRINVQTGKSESHNLTILENKICYSFDIFCEKFTMVGKLLLTHNAKIKERTGRQSGNKDQYDDLSDVDIWWDALDLSYWSSLLVWGSDSEEFIKNEKATLLPFFSTWDPDNKDNKIEDLVKSESLKNKNEEKNTKNVLNGETSAVLQEKTFDKIKENFKTYMEDKKIDIPLSNFKPDEIFFHANVIKSNKKVSPSDYVRISMMNYIRAYYPEVLSIAFILSFHDHVEVKQDDLKSWLKILGIEENSDTPYFYYI